MYTGLKLGPFVIEEELGSGAMGTVYRAQYKDKALRVAIKVMLPGIGTSETAQARFQREAEILKSLQHTNIVRLLAVGRFKNSPFYAMEFIEGETLDVILARRGRLTWEELIQIGKQLCSALQHAHDKSVVHRDLKPSNLMMLPDGTVKLTDFGIAKAIDMTGLTATNCTVGTASYMSPEQCKGEKDISHKSDLYSMGIMFYELITGRKPFYAESVLDMFMLHVKGAFERPSKYVIDIPVWLDNLICQLLEKKPEDRPVSARVVGETLQGIIDKVEAQKSAGVERANSRMREKAQHRPRMNDVDREAALTLLGKKKKKKKTPIHQQGWFTLLVLLLVLGGFAYGIYYVFFTPPTLKSLRTQTAELILKGDLDSLIEARDGPLQSFHFYYSDSEDPDAKELREWAEDVETNITIQQMHNRRNGGFKEDDKGETLARLALGQEDIGKVADAMVSWKTLAKQVGDKNKDKHNWGLVGKKSLKELETNAYKTWPKLFEKVEDEPQYLGQSREEKLAVKAIQALLAKDFKESIEHWEELKKKTEEEISQRSWYILAAYQIRLLSDMEPSGDKEKKKQGSS